MVMQTNTLNLPMTFIRICQFTQLYSHALPMRIRTEQKFQVMPSIFSPHRTVAPKPRMAVPFVDGNLKMWVAYCISIPYLVGTSMQLWNVNLQQIKKDISPINPTTPPKKKVPVYKSSINWIKLVIFHSHVKLPDGIWLWLNPPRTWKTPSVLAIKHIWQWENHPFINDFPRYKRTFIGDLEGLSRDEVG